MRDLTLDQFNGSKICLNFSIRFQVTPKLPTVTEKQLARVGECGVAAHSLKNSSFISNEIRGAGAGAVQVIFKVANLELSFCQIMFYEMSDQKVIPCAGNFRSGQFAASSVCKSGRSLE